MQTIQFVQHPVTYFERAKQVVEAPALTIALLIKQLAALLCGR